MKLPDWRRLNSRKRSLATCERAGGLLHVWARPEPDRARQSQTQRPDGTGVGAAAASMMCVASISTRQRHLLLALLRYSTANASYRTCGTAPPIQLYLAAFSLKFRAMAHLGSPQLRILMRKRSRAKRPRLRPGVAWLIQ